MSRKKQGTIESKDVADEEIRKAIGARIREMRGKLHLSAANIANELGLSREAITQIETGRNNVSAVSLWKLATLFCCDFRDFFPSVPGGYGLSQVDLHTISQEGGDRAARWAETLFKKKSRKN